MKNKGNKNLAYLTLVLLGTLGACAKGIDSGAPLVQSPATTRIDTTQTRLCTTELTHGSLSAQTYLTRLTLFMGTPIEHLEGPVTVCFSVSGTGDNITGRIRIEYESDEGVRSYDSDKQAATNSTVTYVGQVKMGEASNGDLTKSVEVILMDQAGFIEVKGSGVNDNDITAQVKFYNFPSLQDQLTQAANNAADACRTGKMTVAQCMGYNFPSTFWWNQPVYVSPQQALIDQAISIMGTKGESLGTMSFSLSSILNAQF